MAYVEVKAKTVELAVEAAMRELSVTDRDRLEVKVLQEPERGFLGFGGQDAIVRVEERRGGDSRQRRRRGGKARQEGSRAERGRGGNQPKGGGDQQDANRGANRGGGKAASAGNRSRGGNSGNGGKSGQQRGGGNPGRQNERSERPKEDDRDVISAPAQEPLVEAFLAGLVEAFGLEGRVETRIDEDVIVANVVGDQTEALVGPRGSVMEAVHELTKTVLQRTAQDSARVRIDIAGYAERRRQALTIYAGDLIEQVLADGGEIMLDPMSAADRKVIHDAVGIKDGVRSYSEGEAPDRYVVIAAEAATDEEE